MLNLGFFISEPLWLRGKACAFHAASPGSIPGGSLQLFILFGELFERYQPCQAGSSLRKTLRYWARQFARPAALKTPQQIPYLGHICHRKWRFWLINNTKPRFFSLFCKNLDGYVMLDVAYVSKPQLRFFHTEHYSLKKKNHLAICCAWLKILWE